MVINFKREAIDCITSTFAAEIQTNAKTADSAQNISLVLEWANPAWRDTKPFALIAAFAILLVPTGLLIAERTCFQEKT